MTAQSRGSRARRVVAPGVSQSEAGEAIGLTERACRTIEDRAVARLMLNVLSHPELYDLFLSAGVRLDTVCPGTLVEYLATRSPKKNRT